jgi:DNA helicase HerA-like ATPase
VLKKRSLIDRWVGGEGAPHLAIVGRSGAGKTMLARHLVMYLLTTKTNSSVIVLDFDNEYFDLGLPSVLLPFPLPRVSLAWLISQAARPSGEEGIGGFGIAGLLTSIIEDIEEEKQNRNGSNIDDISNIINEIISRIRHDFSIPNSIRFGALWRLRVLRKYFVIARDNVDFPKNCVVNISAIPDVRERQIVQQLLSSILVYTRLIQSPDPLFLFIEEGVSGDWISDLIMLARHRGARIIYVSQSLPPSNVLPSFEVVLFTPFLHNPRPQLPLPTDPATDRGVWWVGALGVHRLKPW